jgi:hypothetical protein
MYVWPDHFWPEATSVLVKVCGGEDTKKVMGDSKKQSGILDQLSKEVSNDMVDMNPLFAPFYFFSCQSQYFGVDIARMHVESALWHQ